MSDQSPLSAKKTDWHDVRQKTIAGIIVAVILAILGGAGTLLWNASQGGLMRALGGPTLSEPGAANNPFIGTWQLDDENLRLLCMQRFEVTEKSIRSPHATQLYTLVRDGSSYIFDTKEPNKIVATLGSDKTMILQIGWLKCPLRRVN